MPVTEKVARFVHHLRAHDFDVSTRDGADMLASLESLGWMDYQAFYGSSRSICSKSAADWKKFPRVFDSFWRSQSDDSAGGELAMPVFTRAPGAYTGLAGATEVFSEFDDLDPGSVGAGRQITISKADFRFLGNAAAMKEVEFLAEKLARTIKSTPGRRKTVKSRGRAPSIPATTRLAVRYGGVAARLRYSTRRREPPRLVIIQDVSHSMTFNNPLLTRFARGIVRRFNNAEAFVFHTRLYRITPLFRRLSLPALQRRLEQNNRLWLGGTCIADSLEQFRSMHGASSLKAKSVVVIMSDGCDSNSPDRLHHELESLRRAAGKVIWLNPMLGRKGFNADKPEVQGIRSRVDALLPAHSLESLRDCISHF